MNNLTRSVVILFSLGLSVVSAAPVILQLKDGTTVTADTTQISLEGAKYFNETGQRVLIPRDQIAMYRFPPSQGGAQFQPVANGARPQTQPPSKVVSPAPSGPTSPTSPASTSNQEIANALAQFSPTPQSVGQQLNTKEARAQFAQIKSQILGSVKGDTSGASQMANELYEQLASGNMSVEQLMGMANQTLGTVDGFKKERESVPQYEGAINVLRQLTQR